jgi:hypothetical protein
MYINFQLIRDLLPSSLDHLGTSLPRNAPKIFTQSQTYMGAKVL